MLFNKNYIVYYNVYYYDCVVFIECIPSFVLVGCCMSELHGHLCPYSNVLPEAVYCCFTRTTLFSKLFTCLTELEVAFTLPSFVTLHLLVSEIAKCIA